ncbi:MAG: thiamine pyrophosphate-dependent enzyme, partial [Burkholderiaceae bacterium]
MPAALGAKLARTERTVIAAVGDGSYLFANPSACHQVSITHHLPVLTVLFNNGRWQAVKRATLSMYPDGEAAALAPMPLTDLGPAPGPAIDLVFLDP